MPRRSRVLLAMTAFCSLALGSPTLAPPTCADPRPREPMSAAEIQHALDRLQVVGSVLYVAAHPDDENTAFLAWASKGRKVRAGYLSMTRGDGGQNLIGPELGDALGVIRTNELMAARREDGAEQWFTRAVDFGFSKGPDETLAIWGRDSVLADVVWAIRRFQPDVVVTRFPTDGAGGHGHHTASALLAEEAFAAAADAKRFPEQLAFTRPWQAKRLVWNVFNFGPAPKVDSTWVRVDVGAYDPLLGRAFTEIAAVSRSNHKSQGFGSAERRGSIPNYFAPRLGPAARRDLFEGVDLTWNRLAGGARIAAGLARAQKEFRPAQPASALPGLLEAHAALLALSQSTRAPEPRAMIDAKLAELRDVIRSCSGLWLEAVALRPAATPGSTVRVATSVLNRSSQPVRLFSVGLRGRADMRPPGLKVTETMLEYNIARADTFEVPLDPGVALTPPYWLAAPTSKGLHRVAAVRDVGRPENEAVLTAQFFAMFGTTPVQFDVPVAHRSTDPVQGERWRPFDIVPPASLKLDEGCYLFPDLSPRDVKVVVQAQRAGVAGDVRLRVPTGWGVEPVRAPIALAKEGEETTVRFRVTPAAAAAGATISAGIEVDGRTWTHRVVRIDYPHIPVQTLFPLAEARVVRADVKRVGTSIGYLMGSGDSGPEALRQMGYAVSLLTDDDVEGGDLTRFQTIVVGTRAYNTRPRLKALQPRLLEWTKAGGTLVVQYSTTGDGPLDALGPLPFKVSRDRVTVEEAEVRLLKPAHPVLTRPNPITSADFDGWVQERGLYFANPIDPGYDTPLSCNDPGEPARDGGLLVAKHGKGVFVYAAFAFFRQLPAGVPGAWKLFANLVSARP